MATRAPLEQRFWRKAERRAPDECWPWLGSIDIRGYGNLRVGTRLLAAHRLSWELAKGPIPAGLFVCHSCDRRDCVNPQHLFVGDQRANMRDMAAKGRWRNQYSGEPARTHCPHGHEYTHENTYRYGRARWCRACGRIRKQHKAAGQSRRWG